MDKGFFPLDEELAILPGKLTLREHECLVRLAGWMPFESAVEVLGDFLGIEISQIVAQNYTETAGAMYVQMQEEEVARLEREMPEAAGGAEKIQISADGAMVPLLHGVWAEVRTLVVGEVQPAVEEKGEPVVHTRNLSYFSRKVTAQEFGRLALVEMHRRGVERAKQVAAVMDGADWEQSFVDFHCPAATRILDFAHAAEHLNEIGEFLHGEHTSESQAWLKQHLHDLKQEGPDPLLRQFKKLQRKHPSAEAISRNLAYLKKRQAQMQYPLFQAQGWPIGSGIVESGNKLVVQARLKGAGMHWHEAHINPMLAIRNILCSGRWREDWPKIEAWLHQHAHQQRRLLHRRHHPPAPTTRIARALQGDFGDPAPDHLTACHPNQRNSLGATSNMARLSSSVPLLRKFKSHPLYRSLRLTYRLNPAKLPPVLPLRGEQFNCQPKVEALYSLALYSAPCAQNFPFEYGFGIIPLLNCAKRPAYYSP